SAVEPYIYDHMTPENREQLGVLAEDMWRIMLDGISSKRNIPVEELDRYADTLEFVNAQRTIESNIIDGLKYYDEILAILKTKKGLDVEDKDSKLNLVDFADYQQAISGGEAMEELKDLKQSKVAVVYAVGAIESGEGNDQTIGSDRIAKALREARLDEDVKAIVLRVNSPGGSALASDIIWRETELIKVSGKPFFVSMGDYAASGGYYIACNADRIYANPNTITGSIGVFGVIPNLKAFLDEKIGITFDRYETNPHADAISIFKPMDTLERAAMNSMISQIYDEFTSKVASGRHMLQSDVDSIARGRVWSGEDALTIGLVDELGDLNACIVAAAQNAGLTDYKRVDMPTMIDPLDKLIQDLKTNRSRAVLGLALGRELQGYERIYEGLKMEGPQARLPFIMQVH
ncbi:MAG: signal peptide peptidase SppA, partial [Flavobacteriales bacterium]